eukprot:TRINITY_DN1397_c0_g1_i1.p1 TRINITY_DN1397_c0_g1~~TRINITY_DN1397_c0_g1_i1.p1  ORF type:complete len:324 (+),score=19.87 TRINITY_DN1397_c0_g1_i1:76-1047(+)
MKSNFTSKFLRLSQPSHFQISNPRSRFQSIDWKYFASIKVEQLENYLDFDVLQRILPFITFCDVVSEFETMDTNFQKFNQLCQFIIRYLLQSQNELFEDISLLNMNIDRLADQIQLHFHKTTAQRKEIHNLRKQIFLLRSHMPTVDPGDSLNNKTKFPCMKCDKVFYSLDYLRSHDDRRHTPSQFGNTSAYDSNNCSSSQSVHKIPKSTNSIPNLKDVVGPIQLNTLSENAIVELIENKIDKHVSIVEQNLKLHVNESQDHFISDINSTVLEEIVRNSSDYGNFKESLVCEIAKQDNMMSELETLLNKCQNLVDDLKSQIDRR